MSLKTQLWIQIGVFLLAFLALVTAIVARGVPKDDLRSARAVLTIWALMHGALVAISLWQLLRT